MSESNISVPGHGESTFYEIRIKGHLNERWVNWFEGLIITLEEGGDTLLTGPVVDQSALYGLLRKVRDVGMPLLSVNSLCSSDQRVQFFIDQKTNGKSFHDYEI